MRTISNAVLSVLLVGGVLAVAAPADAAGPPPNPTVIDGQLAFYNDQTEYCDDSALDCTGAKFKKSDSHSLQPVRGMKYTVVGTSGAVNGQVLGQGYTNINDGYFSAVLVENETTVYSAVIKFNMEHWLGRYRVTDLDGGEIVWEVPILVLPDSINFVGLQLVSNGFPDPLFNAFDGARMMWHNSLAQSARMTTYFNDVQIRAFGETTSGGNQCVSACAYPADNFVQLENPDAAYRPQIRVMHELGHVATYVAAPDQEFTYAGNYTWSLPGQPPGDPSQWGLDTGEYGAVMLEEGLASHLADVARYFPNAATPRTCRQNPADCAISLEDSPGFTCATDRARSAYAAQLYLWDNYDVNVDAAWPEGETLAASVSSVIDTIHAFGNGVDNRQKDEPWDDATYTLPLDNRDGRSILDYAANWTGPGSGQSSLIRNCYRYPDQGPDPIQDDVE